MKILFTLWLGLYGFMSESIRINNLVLELPIGYEIPKGTEMNKDKNVTSFVAIGLEVNDKLEFKMMPRIADVTVEKAMTQLKETYKPEMVYPLEKFKSSFFEGHIASVHNNENTTVTQTAVLRNDINAFQITIRQTYKSKEQADKTFRNMLNSVEKIPVKKVKQK